MPVFTGNRALDERELERVIAGGTYRRRRCGRRRAWSSRLLADAYRTRGYRGVKVTAGEPRLQGGRAELPVTIVEGPIYRIGEVTVKAPPDARRAEPWTSTPPLKQGDAVHRQPRRRRDSSDADALSPRGLSRHASRRRRARRERTIPPPSTSPST